MQVVDYFGKEEPKKVKYLTVALDFENQNLLIGETENDVPDIRVMQIVKNLQNGAILAIALDDVRWATEDNGEA